PCIVQRASDGRPNHSAHSQTSQRSEKKQAEEPSQESTTDRSQCRQSDRLVQLDSALGTFNSDDRVLEINQICLLLFFQFQSDFLGLERVIIADCNQCAHIFLS